jgi:hypothetical protein
MNAEKRRTRIPNPVQLNMTIPQEILWGIEKLAHEDQRSTRDYIRFLLKRRVEQAITEGEITPGPMEHEGIVRDDEDEDETDG